MIPTPERRSICALAALVAAWSVACSGASTRPPEPAGDVTVFRNFTLIDGTDRDPVPAAAMVVDGGRISSVGPAATVNAPPSALVVDLGGAFVMPGLINLHGHLGNTVDLTQDKAFHTRESVERNLKTYAAYGVTSVLSMGTDQDLIFPIRDAQRSGRPTVARVLTAGQGLVFKGGYGGLAGVNEPVATAAEAERAVAAQADKHVDVIKLWVDTELGSLPVMPAEITQAVIEAAHRRSLRAVAHVFYLSDARRLVDQGVDGFVHMVRDKPVDAALIEGMKKHGTWQIAGTLSREASMFEFGVPSPLLHDPFFTRGMSEKARQLLASPERQKTVASGPHFKEYPAFLETAKANLKAIADAGIPFAFGTDTGPPGRFPGSFEHWELQLMAEAGLSTRQVLAAATKRAAEFLGAKDLGTLEPAKWADFVVLEANPLDDIRNTRKIRRVYLAGREVASIDQLDR